MRRNHKNHMGSPGRPVFVFLSLLYMVGAARKNLTLFITLALDRNALCDACSLNSQYNYKSVSRQSNVYSVGVRRRL